MKVENLRELEGLSPFEIKDFLARAASKTASASAIALSTAENDCAVSTLAGRCIVITK